MNKEAKVMRQDALWNIMKYACSFLAVMIIGSLLILWQGENPAILVKYIWFHSISPLCSISFAA